MEVEEESWRIRLGEFPHLAWLGIFVVTLSLHSWA
jgi:hypothetical protein